MYTQTIYTMKCIHIIRLIRMGNQKEIKKYPKPDYGFCNAGHALVEVYDESRNAIVWDCPLCKWKMEQAEKEV